MIAPTVLLPYRIDWRPSRDTPWTLVVNLTEHPGNLRAFIEGQVGAGEGWAWVGEWRLVRQAVIATAEATD